MIDWFSNSRSGPIGVDLGVQAVKLAQLDPQSDRIVDAVRWDVAPAGDADLSDRQTAALRQALEGRGFRGRDAVLSLTAPELFVQNLRVPKVSRDELDGLVFQEAAARLPMPIDEAELRYLEAGDVRQGDTLRREVIVLAIARSDLERQLQVVTGAGLRPVAIDVAPCALVRCYARQFRREEDEEQGTVLVKVGTSRTTVVITAGTSILFVKYLDIGGQQMDQAVARHLRMELDDARALRRHNGDRRADQRDPDVARGIYDSVRPILGRLANELSMCIRYHGVTFRGQALGRLLVGGGEASPALVEALNERLSVPCELGDPLRELEGHPSGRSGAWDVASGLAMWRLN